jgi:hypothetical protein
VAKAEEDKDVEARHRGGDGRGFSEDGGGAALIGEQADEVMEEPTVLAGHSVGTTRHVGVSCCGGAAQRW